MALGDVVERMVESLAQALAARTQEILARQNGTHSIGRRGKPCPVPTCGKPGYGPRNRYFCKEHAHSLTVNEKARFLRGTGFVRGVVQPNGTVRIAALGGSPLKGLKLNMRCRYPRCFSHSKGPRFSFLCEEHYKLPKRARAEAIAQWHKDHPRTSTYLHATG